jgi:putative ABC transport system permease protein
VAFTVFIVIMTQTYWELTFNKKIKQHERIFRMVSVDQDGNFSPVASRPHGETIGKSSPPIEVYTCISPSGEGLIKTIETNDPMKEVNTYLTKSTPSITDLLSLECVAGDFKRLEEPNAAIISKTLSDLLFSENDPLASVVFSNSWVALNLNIVAVYKDLPNNCTFKNGIFTNVGDHLLTEKSNRSYRYFYKLKDANAKNDVELIANKIYKEMRTADEDEEDEEDDEEENREKYLLEPFSNLYYSHVPFGETGSKALTNLLTSIAIIILLIAIINYINFFMAMVPLRIRNVNINKVFGTPTSALRLNITGETVGMLILAFGLALLTVQYLSDTFINDLMVTSLKIENNLFIITMIAVFMIIIGIIVGLFPAFYITKYNPALILKGSFGRSKQGQIFRNTLIVFQFTISVILIIGAAFIHIQSRYMQKYDYGFNRDRLVTVRVSDKIASEPQAFVTELRKNKYIEDVGYAAFSIIGVGQGWGRNYNGENISFSNLMVSWNYPECMGIKLSEGRFFMEEDAAKIGGTIIFNETAAKQYNIKVGDFIVGHNDREKAEIVGIVKDFNFTSLQNKIEPLALYECGVQRWWKPSVAHIRLTPDADFKQTSQFIASVLQKLDPTFAPEKISITSFDESIENLYTKETNLTKIISLFSVVAILISLMGVFGIVVFENQHRRKEIALRKIHGSTATLILGMFNRKFIYILLISFVIAAPIAYFGIVKWLSGFAYRTPIYGWVFAGGFLLVAFITLLTVTLQTLSVANENPIRAIKTE